MELQGASSVNQIRLLAKELGWAGAVTLLSLLSAWTSIYFVLEDNAKLAIAFSVLAFLLDTLDGFLARKLGTVSEFGRFFDSMVDAINYSLVAALVTERLLLPNIFGFLIGFLILACGILRLVLFTIKGFKEEGNRLYYTGIITPHLALAVALIFLISKMVTIPDYISALILTGLAIGQLATFKTLKTGVLIFWIPVSLALAVGSFIWLK
jgi:CDP-diacylglycerol--serine O-phosphatidyltransferase